jgi:hypothetical protein
MNFQIKRCKYVLISCVLILVFKEASSRNPGTKPVYGASFQFGNVSTNFQDGTGWLYHSPEFLFYYSTDIQGHTMALIRFLESRIAFHINRHSVFMRFNTFQNKSRDFQNNPENQFLRYERTYRMFQFGYAYAIPFQIYKQKFEFTPELGLALRYNASDYYFYNSSTSGSITSCSMPFSLAVKDYNKPGMTLGVSLKYQIYKGLFLSGSINQYLFPFENNNIEIYSDVHTKIDESEFRNNYRANQNFVQFSFGFGYKLSTN